MIREQTLSWTRAQAAARLHSYRVLFLVTIAGNLLIGLWCLFDPASFAGTLHQPAFEAWPRAWAATWFALNLVYLPSLSNPLFYRWPSWSIIVINFAIAIVFLSLGRRLLPFAIWGFITGILLLIAYYRLILADVQSKP